MENIISRQLDKQDALEEKVDAFIEELFKSINIKAIMPDAETELMLVADELMAELDDNYSEDAEKIGRGFAKEVLKRIEKDKEIVIQKTTDPNLNEGK